MSTFDPCACGWTEHEHDPAEHQPVIRHAVIDPQDLAEVERLRALIGIEVYTDHLSNALAAFARGERGWSA